MDFLSSQYNRPLLFESGPVSSTSLASVVIASMDLSTDTQTAVSDLVYTIVIVVEI